MWWGANTLKSWKVGHGLKRLKTPVLNSQDYISSIINSEEEYSSILHFL